MKLTVKRSKFENKKITDADGTTFDSKAEYRRWNQLALLQRAGHISNLERQVVYVLADAVVLDGRRKPALRYLADMRYVDASGAVVVEDVKGIITPAYRIKRHLMKSIHGIDVREVTG